MTNRRPFRGRIDRNHVVLVFYILETLIGAAIGYGIYCFEPTLGMWCLISIVLVLAPDQKDTMMLATNRIKANLVGAAIGLCSFFIHPTNFAMICFGLAASILLCEWMKIQHANRTAAASVLIVSLHEPGKYFWQVAADRAGGVVLGCLIGILITYSFHRVVQWIDSSRAGPLISDRTA